jgi:hypothetical protein
MSQGFNSRRYRPSDKEQSRWARFSHSDIDPIPTYRDIQLVVIGALLCRIKAMDRTKRKQRSTVMLHTAYDNENFRASIEALLDRIEELDRTTNKDLAKRIRLYIRMIAFQEQWPNEFIEYYFRSNNGHWDVVFNDELSAIARGKLVSFTCIPAVLRLHRDHVYSYMSRRFQVVNGRILGDGYAPRQDSPRRWLERNCSRLNEELSFWHCSCVYRPEFGNLDSQLDGFKGPGELIPALLAALHTGNSASSIQQILKRTSRPGKIPPFLA